MKHVKVLIIGSGPAGYTAAIYASRANLQPLLIEGNLPGGQLTTTTDVENFPGYPQGVNGFDMMEDLRSQATRFGTEIVMGEVTKIDSSVRPFCVFVDGEQRYFADTIIYATGSSAKYLGLPEEEKYRGVGLSACATCDGFFFRDKVVAVVGGGDTACEEASYLASICKKVYLIVRKPHLRASKLMQQRVAENDKIEILFENQVVALHGETKLQTIDVRFSNENEVRSLEVDGIFMAIGHTPNVDLIKDFVELDEQGYIRVNSPMTTTNVPGFFAAGDVSDPHYRQAINAAASGCRAAMDAERYLNK